MVTAFYLWYVNTLPLELVEWIAYRVNQSFYFINL